MRFYNYFSKLCQLIHTKAIFYQIQKHTIDSFNSSSYYLLMVPNKRAVKYVLTLKKACNVRKMYCKGFFLELWNIVSSLNTSREVTVVRFLSGGRLQTEIVFLLRELHFTRFPVNFPKFSVKLFQNTLTKASVTKFSNVLRCIPYSCVLIKKLLHQTMFPEILVIRLFLHKSWQFIPILVTFYNISKTRFNRRQCLTRYRQKYLIRNSQLSLSVLVKKALPQHVL